MIFRVLEKGLFTLIQAAPRRGFQHFGISAGGPMDLLSHRAANRILGNAPDAATLEILMAGLRLEVLMEVLVTLTGGDMGATADGAPLPMGCPVRLARGTVLAFENIRKGCRAYLGVHGGISVPEAFGSRGTDTKGGFGGHRGRALLDGDVLYRGGGLDPFPELQIPEGESFAALPPQDHRPWAPDLDSEAVLRLIPGAHFDLLTAASREALLGGGFKVHTRSNRQGLRLDGPPLKLEHPVELISEGTVFGTLQLPPDDPPVLLMADRQSTGGFPRLGEVYSVDLSRAAQLRPEAPVRFVLGTLEAARAAAWAASCKGN